MSESAILAIIFVALYLPLIGYAYGRQRRWYGLAGWTLLMAGLLLAFGGAGDAFAWAGLLWAYIAAFGALLIVTDVYLRRSGR